MNKVSTFLRRLFLFLIFIGLAAAVGILAYYYYNAQEELQSLRDDNVALDSQVVQLEREIEEFTVRVFKDEGMGVNMIYPASWVVSLNVALSDQIFGGAGLSGRIAETYQYSLTKNTSVLTFNQNLKSNQVSTIGISKSTYDYEELSDGETLRYREQGGDWKYGQIVSCEENNIVIQVDICVKSSLERNKDEFPTGITLSSDSPQDILEADKIVQSFLGQTVSFEDDTNLNAGDSTSTDVQESQPSTATPEENGTE